MPASLVSVTPELLTELRDGKQTALEQIFRANFEAFTQDANSRLNDVAAAQTAAASAFVDAWERRATCETVEQLDALLQKALSGETTAELRRRAAAKHPHAPGAAETTDQWWAKVASLLQRSHGSSADAAERAAHSRHEAAAHMKKVAEPKRTGMFIVFIVLLAAASAAVLWYFNKGAEATKAGQLLGRDDAKVLHSKDGQRGAVTLEDSVGIRIGSATTVKYPSHYPLDARALSVAGAAVIKVPAGGPLLVKIGTAWITASNAEFALRNFPDDSGTVMVKVLNGSITMKFDKVEKTLAAGSTTQMLPNGTFMDMQDDRKALAFSWVDNTFNADHWPLRKVLAEMKKWYGIDITTKDSSFLDRPVAMTASLDSAKTAIAALEEGGAVKVTLIAEGKATVADNAAAVAAKKSKRGK